MVSWCHAGHHELAAARVPRHEVGLDQPDHDAQVGLDEAPVDEDGDPGRCPAQFNMRLAVAGEVVCDRHRLEHVVRTDDLAQLLPVVGAVQACGHQDQDVPAVDSGGGEFGHQAGQQPAVRHRPRDVADQDAGAAAAARQRAERRPADRCLEGPGERRGRVGHGWHGVLANRRDAQFLREPHRERAPPVEQINRHVRPSLVEPLSLPCLLHD